MNGGLWAVTALGRPQAVQQAWTTLRVAHTAHSPYDDGCGFYSARQNPNRGGGSVGLASQSHQPLSSSLFEPGVPLAPSLRVDHLGRKQVAPCRAKIDTAAVAFPASTLSLPRSATT
jgi:hypothetical protein